MNAVFDLLGSTLLVERFFGVAVYCLALGYFCNKVAHAGDTRTIDRHLNSYLAVLGIMAFFYIPSPNADLYRWRLLSAGWSDVPFSWVWDNLVLKRATPVGYLLIYICQITGIQGLLPMVCALGFYGNVFHIFKCEARRSGVRARSLSTVLFFFMSTGVFLEVISGVRCMLSFSMALRCAYDEVYREKSFFRHIPVYAAAALLHGASIPLIGIRMVCSLMERKRGPAVMLADLTVIAAALFLGMRYGGYYIDSAVDKAVSYVANDMYSYGWEYLIAVLSLLVMITALWNLHSVYPQVWKDNVSQIRSLIVILLGETALFSEYSIFHRFLTAAMIAAVPVLIRYLDCERGRGRSRSERSMAAMSLVILALACVRGNLCGYKFFVLG
ncbi:MAG: hypothetical protein IJK59_09045 [Firmicutes bacterium]|nr:hypothetical protein [Bacillota bacterium]MBQ6261381.1 hypothetical protein [Bacillota bacterium]MBR0114607.1 hypothetical protein [Bacillota bacterium]